LALRCRVCKLARELESKEKLSVAELKVSGRRLVASTKVRGVLCRGILEGLLAGINDSLKGPGDQLDLG
jgi:hypothetical protein